MKLILVILSFVLVNSAFAANCNWMAKKSAFRHVAKNYDESNLTVTTSKRCRDAFKVFLVAIESDVQTHYMKVRMNENRRNGTCRTSKVTELEAYEGIEEAFNAGRCRAIEY